MLNFQFPLWDTQSAKEAMFLLIKTFNSLYGILSIINSSCYIYCILSIPFMGYKENPTIVILQILKNFQFPLWDTMTIAVRQGRVD